VNQYAKRPPATHVAARIHRREERNGLAVPLRDVEAMVMILEKRFARAVQRLRSSRRNRWHET
jgi:hypothetical protein